MTGGAPPEVSVIIATRNRWKVLATHGLPSALTQRDVDLEVIVVDDASTDDTRLRLLEIEDRRLKVLSHSVNRKLPAARNTGIQAAQGTWLAFLDDDDLWSPHKLRLQIDAAERAQAPWVYGAAVIVDVEKRVLGRDPLPEPGDLPSLLQQGNFVPGGGSNVVVRASMVDRVGGFDEELLFFEDWELWLRLADASLPAVCRDFVMARVEHPNNMVLRDAKQVMPAYVRMISKHGAVTRRGQLSVAEWVAHEHQRAGLRFSAARLYLHAAMTFRSRGNVVAALGALFGDRGMALASRALLAARGASHLEADEEALPPRPSWLDSYV
jgi:glycosyltransferase involved in cell wall biosynthesis